MNTLHPLPRHFYRVQAPDSFTYYDTETGFESRGHYLMPLSHWINRGRFERHLDWNDRSSDPTPFISVFDNEDDAQERVKHHLHHAQWILLACIDTSSLRPEVLEIEFADRLVQLPVWRNDKNGVIFVSIEAVLFHFGVNDGRGQLSEWFALDRIPADMIAGTRLVCR